MNSNRIFGLDMLRAVAILTVMISHMSLIGPPKTSAYLGVGLDGVTLFFVLSGFLIGKLLIKDLAGHSSDRAALIHFWSRRWLRTLPAYFFVLSVLLVFAAQRSGAMPDYWQRYYFFAQNVFSGHPIFFSEAWSLAVEEWFYLLLPLGILFFRRWRRFDLSKSFLTMIIGVILAVTLARIMRMASLDVQTLQQWDLGFRKIVVLRLDSLMYGVFGAWLACFNPAFWSARKGKFFATGVALLLADVALSSVAFWRDYLTLSITPFATLLMLPLLSDWKVPRYKILHAITFVSIISYSLYLVHLSLVLNTLLPILNGLFPPEYFSKTALVLVYWGLSFGLAFLCRRFVEVPFIEFRDARRAAASATKPAQ